MNAGTPALSLTDQLGAMGIIDTLRQQHLRIEEHLDLPRRRVAIAERIREYYASQGIPVDDDMIEAGVRRYFADRLTPAPINLTPLGARLANLFVTRGDWSPKAARIGVVIAAIGLVIGGIAVGIRSYVAEQAQASLVTAVAGFERTKEALGVARSSLTTLKGMTVTYAAAPVGSAIVGADNKLAYCDDVAARGSAAVKKAADGGVVEAQTGAAVDAAKALFACIQEVDNMVGPARRLADADGRFVTLEHGDLYRQYRTLAPVEKKFVVARTALRMGGDDAFVAVDAAFDAIRQAGGLQPIAADILTLTEKFKAMSMPSDDRKIIDSLLSDANSAMEATDARTAGAKVRELWQLHAMASTDLVLNVVSRVGMQSGVRRTFSASGGHAYYLVVEATTPAGDAVSIPVLDSENGKTSLVSVFGVRVSEDEFNKVRAEKMQDGHVHNRFVGNKPRGHLKFSYARPVLTETITAW